MRWMYFLCPLHMNHHAFSCSPRPPPSSHLPQVHLSGMRAKPSITSAGKAVRALLAAAKQQASAAAAAAATPGKGKKGKGKAVAAVAAAPVTAPAPQALIASAVQAAREVAAQRLDLGVGACVFARVSDHNRVVGLGKKKGDKKGEKKEGEEGEAGAGALCLCSCSCSCSW
jgi:hypothetical protein